MRAVRQAVPDCIREAEVLLRLVRERGAQEREQAARGRVPRDEERDGPRDQRHARGAGGREVRLMRDGYRLAIEHCSDRNCERGRL